MKNKKTTIKTQKLDEVTMKRCAKVTAILLSHSYDAGFENGKKSAYRKVINFEVFLLTFFFVSLFIINLF